MPDDEVYISVAPYREQTHDCYFHSLTTCLGELANAEVQVTLTSDDGEVLVNETRQTYDNGFIGIYWIPRGIEATLTIDHKGQTGTTTISTMNDDDPDLHHHPATDLINTPGACRFGGERRAVLSTRRDTMAAARAPSS